MSVRHIRTAEFKKCYGKLPPQIQQAADRQFERLKENPQHPSLQFRQLSSRSDCWYARVTDDYRALATKYQNDQNVYIWFWIGTHAKFNALTARPKNLGPANLLSDRIEQQQTPLTTSLVSSWQGSSQLSREDVNAELDNLIHGAISDFNEDRYEEWR